MAVMIQCFYFMANINKNRSSASGTFSLVMRLWWCLCLVRNLTRHPIITNLSVVSSHDDRMSTYANIDDSFDIHAKHTNYHSKKCTTSHQVLEIIICPMCLLRSKGTDMVQVTQFRGFAIMRYINLLLTLTLTLTVEENSSVFSLIRMR